MTGADFPPVPPGLSAESTIRRDADGQWYHEGAPVEHPAVNRSFDQWVDRHPDGRYVLRNNVNWAYVEIDGPPVTVRRVDLGSGGADLHLSDARTEALDPATLRVDAEGRLYCQVRTGRLTAVFSRQAMFDLESAVDVDDEGIFIALEGQRFRPPTVENPIE